MTFSILLLGGILELKKEHSRKKFLFISALLMILVNGMRNIYLGVDDTYNYYEGFTYAQNSSISDILMYTTKDPFYYVFAKYAGYLTFHNFTCYLLFVASVFIGSYMWMIKKYSPNLLLSVVLFLSFGVFSVSMFLVRQILAISVLMYSIKFLQSRNVKGFYLCVLIAALFHTSALVFAIVYPLLYVKINLKTILAYIASIILVMQSLLIILDRFGIFMIDLRFAGYENSERTLSLSGFFQMALLLLVCLYRKKQIQAKFNNINTDILFHLSFIALVFQSGTIVIAEMFRIALYFKMFLFILVPMAFSTFDNVKKRRYTICLYILLIAYYIKSVYNTDYAFFWEHYVPQF